MTSVLSVASSSSSASHYSSADSSNHVPPSPGLGLVRSAASSPSSLGEGSLQGDDDENLTITLSPAAGATAASTVSTSFERQLDETQDDLRLLAISTHITELSYAISDIQTRIFEIQELRHKSQSQSSDASSSTNKDTNVSSVIDQSLMNLDERLESVEKGIKTVTENLAVYDRAPSTIPTPTTAKTITIATTPTIANSTFMNGSSNEVTALLRKHATLLAEWETVQDDSDVLREELKEDKWLTVFRTVTDQADGMMSSLEKAVSRCQDFIYQAHHRRTGITSEDFFSATTPSSSRNPSSERQPMNLDTFNSLLESYEAKKKHYMPATSKVLAIIDRGVRDRVTKNGETLRRHSESAQRWKTLRDRISRTDADLENVRRVLLNADLAESDNGSSTSGTHPSTSQNGHAVTPSSGTRSKGLKADKAGTLSRSISPFRKFARKITGSSKNSSTSVSPGPAVTPLSVSKKAKLPPVLATTNAPTTQTLRRQRTSLFTSTVKNREPLTPDRIGHKYSQSVTPESSPRLVRLGDSTTSVDQSYSDYTTLGKSQTSLLSTPSNNLSYRPTWNSSTKVEDERKVKTTTVGRGSRPPSANGMYKSFSSMGEGEAVPPVPPLNTTGTPYRRSLSRASMTSSRPWSPITSSTSQSSSQYVPPIPMSINSSISGYSYNSRSSRPPSRAQTPSRSISGTGSLSVANTPRTRSKTPSHIPGPSNNFRSISASGAGQNGSPGDMYSPENYNRSFSPTHSVSGMSSTGGTASHPPRPPSRSMIPIPSVHLSATSMGARSASSMSHIPGGYNRSGSESPTLRMAQFKAGARRAQTPDMMTMTRSVGGRPSLPPSSFRDGNGSVASPSRPSSRAGASTSSFNLLNNNNSRMSLDQDNGGEFTFEYIVGNPKDPLDAEVGRVVNSIPHGLVVERVDPPLKKAPKEGEEVKAQYAFSNAFGKKIVSCRLTTLTRATRVQPEVEGEPAKPKLTMVTTKKVMCRVGGGWQDLGIYIMNRQAGL